LERLYCFAIVTDKWSADRKLSSRGNEVVGGVFSENIVPGAFTPVKEKQLDAVCNQRP
jgi:hypothetical protein